MSKSDDPSTLELLRQATDGDIEARDQAWQRVHEEVLRVAGAQRRRWSGDWTLETRVLANEVFIKLFGSTSLAPNSREHFFALLSRAIRQILVNYSEAKSAAKRGGGAAHVSLDEDLGIALDPGTSDDILDLNAALQRFEELDPRAAKVVELLFFAGLSHAEVAEALGISKATAERDWSAAKAWLNRELTGPATIELLGRSPGEASRDPS